MVIIPSGYGERDDPASGGRGANQNTTATIVDAGG